MKFLLGLVSAMFVAGCAVVTSDTPICRETSRELQNELRGVWRCDDSVIYVRFDSKGRGVFASLEWEDTEFEKKEGEFFAREYEDWNYVSARSLEEEDKDDGYILGAFKRLESGELVMWPAEIDAFSALVEGEKIEGEVSGKYVTSVRVTDGAKLLELIDEPRDFFALEDPIVFHPVCPTEETAKTEEKTE